MAPGPRRALGPEGDEDEDGDEDGDENEDEDEREETLGA